MPGAKRRAATPDGAARAPRLRRCALTASCLMARCSGVSSAGSGDSLPSAAASPAPSPSAAAPPPSAAAAPWPPRGALARFRGGLGGAGARVSTHTMAPASSSLSRSSRPYRDEASRPRRPLTSSVPFGGRLWGRRAGRAGRRWGVWRVEGGGGGGGGEEGRGALLLVCTAGAAAFVPRALGLQCECVCVLAVLQPARCAWRKQLPAAAMPAGGAARTLPSWCCTQCVSTAWSPTASAGVMLDTYTVT